MKATAQLIDLLKAVHLPAPKRGRWFWQANFRVSGGPAVCMVPPKAKVGIGWLAGRAADGDSNIAMCRSSSSASSPHEFERRRPRTSARYRVADTPSRPLAELRSERAS